MSVLSLGDAQRSDLLNDALYDFDLGSWAWQPDQQGDLGFLSAGSPALGPHL